MKLSNPTRVVLIAALAVTALGITTCCKRTRSQSALQSADAASIATGIVGRVEVWEGNFMPPVEPERRNSQIKPAPNRPVRVYAPVRVEGGLAMSKRDTVTTNVIAEGVTDSTGHFAIAVPPGNYSIFVAEDGGWYNNSWNEQGIQGAVNVEEGKTTDVLIKITTKATF
jgi:hypothetical protein